MAYKKGNGIMTSQDVKQKIKKAREQGTLTRAKAIRLHCLDCCGYDAKCVTVCDSFDCPLWGFREGKEEPPGEEVGKPPF